MSGIGATGNSLSRYIAPARSDVNPANSTASQAPRSSASPASAAAPATAVKLSTDASVVATPSGATTKSFADVTVDARVALSANEAKMKASGRPYDYNTATQQDVDNAFAGLDRRSLYAVASNNGNLFTQDEQKQAQSIMSQQLSDAMGLANPLNNSDPAKEYLAGVRFLDTASPEEKASDNWRVNRAADQAGYESNFARDHAGQKAANVDSGDPVVNLLVKAIHNAEGTWSSTTNGSYVTDISKISLFSDGKYDSALQQARNQIAQAGSQSRIDLSV